MRIPHKMVMRNVNNYFMRRVHFTALLLLYKIARQFSEILRRGPRQIASMVSRVFLKKILVSLADDYCHIV